MKTILPVLGMLALTALPAVAHHDGDIFRSADIRVSHAHTDEPSPTAHAIEVYLTIDNTGEEVDRLTAASVSFADPGVFQAHVIGADGTLGVTDVSAIAIEPGQSVSLAPGGARIVFFDVKRTLDGGDHFHMTLTFERAGTFEVEVDVEHDHHDEEHDHGHDHDEETAS